MKNKLENEKVVIEKVVVEDAKELLECHSPLRR